MKTKCFDFDPADTIKLMKVDTATLLESHAQCCICEFNELCGNADNIYYELLERGEDLK